MFDCPLVGPKKYIGSCAGVRVTDYINCLKAQAAYFEDWLSQTNISWFPGESVSLQGFLEALSGGGESPPPPKKNACFARTTGPPLNHSQFPPQNTKSSEKPCILGLVDYCTFLNMPNVI